MNYKTTIHQKGGRTINMHTLAADTKCVTVAMSVTASGKSLHPMVVFKGNFQKRYTNLDVSFFSSPVLHHLIGWTGKCDGQIARRELPLLPDDCHYACQPKAWFDEATMLNWVNTILASYVATVLHYIIPILLLDSFSVHMKGTVTTAIQNLGIQQVLQGKDVSSLHRVAA